MDISNRNFIIIILTITALFQVATIFSPHVEGDELVYLALSKNMGWDFSNYTVMNDTPLNQFPNRLYRARVFIHPPLFPLILKVGSNFVNPVLFGLIFNGLLNFVLAIIMWRFALLLGVSKSAARYPAIFVTACPVLGFIGSRILVDMFFTFSLIAVIYLLIKAGIEQAKKNLFLAVLGCCILFNTKTQAIAYLPLLCFLYLIAVRYALQKGELTIISLRDNILFGILMVGILGFAHYYHLLYSLGLQECLRLLDCERPVNSFITRIGNRSKPTFILYLIMLQPIVLMLIRPQVWLKLKKSLGTIPNSILCVIVVVIYSALLTLFSVSAQERYWAHVFPLVFLLVIVIYDKIQSADTTNLKIIYAGFLLLLFINNFQTNVIWAGSRTAIVFPALLAFFPFLIMPGSIFFNF